VRSDKFIEGPAIVPQGSPVEDGEESDYGYFELSRKEAEDLEYSLAASRMLTPDASYKGTIHKADAKKLLQSITEKRFYRRIEHLGRGTLDTDTSFGPATLYGFTSASQTPTLLLINRETHYMASKLYKRAFTALGARPETYFNFKDDTLYLDDLGRSGRSIRSSYVDLKKLLGKNVLSYDFDRVQNLAISLSGISSENLHDYHYGIGIFEYDTVEWLLDIQQRFRGLKRLIFVHPHYNSSNAHRKISKEDYRTLKFVDMTKDHNHVYPEARLNGYLLGRHVTSLPIDHGYQRALNIKEWVEVAREVWNISKKHREPFNMPEIEFRTITPEAEERRLLQDACALETKHSTGVWYINPQDPTDFQETPVEELDEELADLLDWCAPESSSSDEKL